MATYTLLVMSEPLPGKEAEYEDWYTNTHLNEVLSTPQFQTGRRLRICAGYEAPYPYIAMYEIETDDPQGAMTDVTARASSGEWKGTDSLGPHKVMLFENITPLIYSK